MLSFEQAQAAILGRARPLGREQVVLEAAAGRVLAVPLVAQAPLPAFDYSAMDGYALSARELQGSGPWRLPVVGESRTGAVCERLTPGTACRIFTGAFVPEGADAVVAQEDVERAGDVVVLSRPVRLGQHLRRRGEDLTAGQVALEAGTRLTPFRLSLASAMDQTELLVHRAARVVIVPSGDELRPSGVPGGPHEIPESNGVGLAALVRRAGGLAQLAPALPDTVLSAQQALGKCLGQADLLVTVGGASVGDHDVVHRALEGLGVTLDFWKVAIKPGKPVFFGGLGSTLVLGLPGNPASAQVCFILFGLPLLAALHGDAAPALRFLEVPLAHELFHDSQRTTFYRARWVGGAAEVGRHQASGAVTSLAQADLLIRVEPGTAVLERGTRVQGLFLD